MPYLLYKYSRNGLKILASDFSSIIALEIPSSEAAYGQAELSNPITAAAMLHLGSFIFAIA
jgi:hypothetical protein